MPFLGPAIAVWIVFSILVMVCYFVFIARRSDAPIDLPEPDEPTWRQPRPFFSLPSATTLRPTAPRTWSPPRAPSWTPPGRPSTSSAATRTDT